MSRKRHPQEPHFGKKNNLHRIRGNVISEGGHIAYSGSNRRAKRFMRTGRADRV